MTSSDKEEILAFLSKRPMTVISTVGSKAQGPESALIAFAETSDLEMIFQTLNDARKYQNLTKDSRISLVIGWDIEKSQQITFQYEGIVRELKRDDSKYHKYRSIFEQKGTPCTDEFLDNPKSSLFIATPTWFRYSDYSQGLPRIIEVSTKSDRF